MTSRTSDPLVSPVTDAELSDWLGGVSDPVISGLLLAATDAVIRVLGYDLLPRDWTLTHWDWPIVGTRTNPNLSQSPHFLQREIDLPYAAVQAVASVESYGEVVTGFVAREDSVMLPRSIARESYGDNEEPAIVVNYTAGLDPIPDSVLEAIKMLAAFLYEHRGECDVNDALARSGVSVMLQPFKKYAVTF